MIRVFDGNRRLLRDLLAGHALEIGYTMPDATFLAWLDFGAYGLDGDIAQFLRAQTGVVASSGADTGAGGRCFVRSNFAMSPELLETSVIAIGRSLTGLRSRMNDGPAALAATG